MALIELLTVIDAPQERVFDLARSIDAHQASAEGTHERAVAGRTSGLIGLGEEVTWEARHFGVTQRLRVKITALDRPHSFQDIMLQGAFAWMRHEHFFQHEDGRTLMRDRFEFQSPLGPLGRLFDVLVLTGYMRRFLVKRNAILKRISESNEWKNYLDESDHPPEPIPLRRSGLS